ncbi:MAG TPA: hypothetical protein PKL24_13685 [Polyangiaceae bacterium]|jgi:hypothetical protein|nr:hypothetical protein [Polyangiaceae bacterium]HOD24457.1 hypothetical protein [Polyangiaceae bacterium]HOR34351.1 hypothetical protein [Polyangiaceae bacterium]
MGLAAETASAQMGMPGLGEDGPPPAAGATPTAQPNAPATHAASGGEELGVLPSLEASIPEDPLKLSKVVKKTIGSDADNEFELGRDTETTYSWYGPYYQEKSGQYRFRTVFPFWLEREQPKDTASFISPFYYRRRSPNVDADVVFPLYWNMRENESRTHVIGPLAWRKAPGESDHWLAPLVFQGTRKDGSYLHIPPLLTFTSQTHTSGFNLVGPGYCSWKGGSSCSLSSARDIDFGIAPLYFYGRSETSEYELIPPLLHYYRYDDIGEKSLNLWGPLLWSHTRERSAFHVLPLFYHLWGEDEDHVTLFPVFHYGHKGRSSLFVNPLYMTSTGDKGEKTFVTWGYARYRGRTELDMITPLYWHYHDPDIGEDTHLLLPLLYRSVSPRQRDLAVFPLWGHFNRFGIKKTTWITPLFQHSRGLTGWETNIHPVLYMGRNQDRTHLVVAPIFWDFASPKSRSTVAFPVFWRFDDGNSVSQLLLNTYYQERKLRTGLDWQFHFFPAFSYGETPDGHWWKVMYGLAGYTRRGEMAKIYAAWIPFLLSGDDD